MWRYYFLEKENIWHKISALRMLKGIIIKSGPKKSDTYWNVLLLKNLQILPNLYETWSKWPPGEVSILTKSHTKWAKIVDFLIKAHFSMCPIFFGSDFIIQSNVVYGWRHSLCRHLNDADFCGQGPGFVEPGDPLKFEAHRHFFARKFPTKGTIHKR